MCIRTSDALDRLSLPVKGKGIIRNRAVTKLVRLGRPLQLIKGARVSRETLISTNHEPSHRTRHFYHQARVDIFDYRIFNRQWPLINANVNSGFHVMRHNVRAAEAVL